jgi:competence protein ComFC
MKLFLPIFYELPRPDGIKPRFIYMCFISMLQIWSVIAHFFQDSSCVCCGSSVSLFPVCLSCIQRLFVYTPFSNDVRCQICGRELLSEKGICMDCRRNRVLFHTDRVFAVHSYHLWRKNILFFWKYGQNRIVSFVFASLIYQVLRNNAPENIYHFAVVPVPPRPLKLKTEGWDQVADLCYFLQHAFGMKIAPILVRKSSVPQKTLDRKSRLSSVVSAYTLKKNEEIKKILPVIPPSVFLLDDVITTGATVETCAVLLKSIGIIHVYAVSLFIAD